MKVIDKIKEYYREIADNDEEFYELLMLMPWVNKELRNKECQCANLKCSACPHNFLPKTKITKEYVQRRVKEIYAS